MTKEQIIEKLNTMKDDDGYSQLLNSLDDDILIKCLDFDKLSDELINNKIELKSDFEVAYEKLESLSDKDFIEIWNYVYGDKKVYYMEHFPTFMSLYPNSVEDIKDFNGKHKYFSRITSDTIISFNEPKEKLNLYDLADDIAMFNVPTSVYDKIFD